MLKKLVIATRGSKLAIRQSEIVKLLLLQKFPNIKVDFLLVTTQGDTDQKTPLSSFGNTGVFVKGLEEKLFSGEADLAVHSLKDVPANGSSDPISIGFRSAENDKTEYVQPYTNLLFTPFVRQLTDTSPKRGEDIPIKYHGKLERSAELYYDHSHLKRGDVDNLSRSGGRQRGKTLVNNADNNKNEYQYTHQSQLILAAFPEREDVRDVLVSAEGINWRNLKQGSVVGTSSPARQEQLKLLRPDLIFKDIRGNVETRIQKVLNGEYDATILAAAGLNRLGIKISDESYFTLEEIVPSPGQGALAIQVNKNNSEVLGMVHKLNNKTVEMQVAAERAFMQIIGGGCRFPVAAHAEIRANEIIFRGIAYKPGFDKLEKIKIKTNENDVFERAQNEADQIISKYNAKIGFS